MSGRMFRKKDSTGRVYARERHGVVGWSPDGTKYVYYDGWGWILADELDVLKSSDQCLGVVYASKNTHLLAAQTFGVVGWQKYKEARRRIKVVFTESGWIPVPNPRRLISEEPLRLMLFPAEEAYIA